MSRAKRPARAAGPGASRAVEPREPATASAASDGGLPAAAMALLAGVVALLVLRALAARLPGRGLWGLDLGRDLAPGVFGTGLALTLVACAPAVWRTATRAWPGGPRSMRGPGAWALAIASAALLALFMWNSPDRTLYTGDAILRHGAFAQVTKPELLAEQAMRGDLVLHHAFPRWVSEHTPWTTDQAGRALGSLIALITALAGWRLAAAVGARGLVALAVAMIAACTGALALDNGYGKASVEIAALTSVLAVGVARLAADGRGLGTVGGSLAIALLLHRSALTLLPVWAAGAVVAARAGRLREPRALLGLVAPIASLAFVAPRLWHVITTFDQSHHAAGGAVATLAAAFAPMRLGDSLNTLVFLVPLAPIVPLLLALAPRPTARGAVLGAAFMLPPLALLFVVQPQHELPRDWDVFAFVGSAVAALAAWRLARVLDARPSLRGLALPVALAAVIPAFQWARLQSEPERAWSRAESILAGPPARRTSDVAEGLGTLGFMRLGRGQYEAALKLFERSAEVAPNPRMFVQIGMAETLAGHPERAMERYRHAASLNPNLNAAWRGVAAAASVLGDRASMVLAVENLERLEPDGATLKDARAWLRANPGP